MKCVSFRAIARIFNNKKLQKEIKLMNYVKRLKGISDHWFFFCFVEAGILEISIACNCIHIEMMQLLGAVNEFT